MTLSGVPAPPARPGRPAPLTGPAGLASPRQARSRPARSRRAGGRWLIGGGLGAAALVVLAACAGPSGRPESAGAGRVPSTGGHAAPSVLPSTTPAAVSPAASAPAAAPPLPAAGPSIPAAPPAPPAAAGCVTGGLQASIGAANGAAGSIYYPLDFRNMAGTPCTLYGYPGVSFVARPGGGQVGGAAARNPTFPPALVTLAPGAVAHASVQVVVAQSYPASECRPVTARWLRVYPPGQFTPLYVSLTAQTCTGPIPGGSTLGIYVVRPGANGP